MDPVLRSPRGYGQPSFIRFLNLTRRMVRLIWVDFDGNHRSYGHLKHHQFFDIRTFVGHIWIFIDGDTMELLQSFTDTTKPPAKQFVAQPNDGHDEAHRKWVFITIPVFTLKDICFQTLGRLKINDRTMKDFQLPYSLVEDYCIYMGRFIRKRLLK